MSAAIAGLVVALPQECRSLTQRRTRRGDCIALSEARLICVAGVGPKNAAQAAHRLIEAGAQGLMSWGCAAGLSPTLRPGDLCLPASIVDAQGMRRAASAGWHHRAVISLQATFDLHTGPLLTTDRIAATEADKRSLAEKFGAIAVDMESAAVAAVARDRDVPFLAVRAIADPANMPMPRAVLRATGPQGNIRLSVLLGQVLLHPGDAGGLMRLASHFRAALRTLTRTADRMGLGLLLDEALAA